MRRVSPTSPPELLTRGTAARTGPELDRAIEFVGGSLESESGRDGSTLTLAVLRKDLDLGLDLLADALLRPTFPEEELRRKVSDIQAAIERSEENPEAVGGRALARLLYPGHPYAHPVTGTAESVGKLTREQVVGFHRARYRPDATVIAVVGDVGVDEIRLALSRRLSGWTAPASLDAPIPMAPPSPPVVAEAISRELTQATVYLGRPAVRQDHPDYFPLLVANYILGAARRHGCTRAFARTRASRMPWAARCLRGGTARRARSRSRHASTAWRRPCGWSRTRWRRWAGRRSRSAISTSPSRI